MKPENLHPPGIVLTAAQANALNYGQGAMYRRSSGLNSDPGWEAKRDAGLGITPPPMPPNEKALASNWVKDPLETLHKDAVAVGGVTVGDSASGMSVITEVKTSDSGFTSITKSYESDPPLVVGSVIPDKKSDESSWLAHALKSMTGKETEPNDLSPHTPGAKLDAGKNRLGLVFTDFAKAIEQVGLVATLGAIKYTASGWVSVKGGKERYSDALFRHLVAHAAGEKLDASGLLHLAHAAWNVLAVLELELRTLTPEQKLERK